MIFLERKMGCHNTVNNIAAGLDLKNLKKFNDYLDKWIHSENQVIAQT